MEWHSQKSTDRGLSSHYFNSNSIPQGTQNLSINLPYTEFQNVLSAGICPKEQCGTGFFPVYPGFEVAVSVAEALAGKEFYVRGPYTADSDVATAAVYAGLIKPDEAKILKIQLGPELARYLGSVRNRVTTQEWGPKYPVFNLSVNTQLVDGESLILAANPLSRFGS